MCHSPRDGIAWLSSSGERRSRYREASSQRVEAGVSCQQVQAQLLAGHVSLLQQQCLATPKTLLENERYSLKGTPLSLTTRAVSEHKRNIRAGLSLLWVIGFIGPDGPRCISLNLNLRFFTKPMKGGQV